MLRVLPHRFLMERRPSKWNSTTRSNARFQTFASEDRGCKMKMVGDSAQSSVSLRTVTHQAGIDEKRGDKSAEQHECDINECVCYLLL